jgi:hypothetical protein
MRSRHSLVKRLSFYWKMEALNAVLIPLVAFWAVHPSGSLENWLLIGSLVPSILLLVVGAAYWYAVHARINGNRYPMVKVVDAARIVRLPSLLLTLVSLGLAAFALTQRTAVAYGVVIIAALTVLEWINYYVVQLQHFDNQADFKRMISGKGFMQAHLAREIVDVSKKQSAQKFDDLTKKSSSS